MSPRKSGETVSEFTVRTEEQQLAAIRVLLNLGPGEDIVTALKKLLDQRDVLQYAIKSAYRTLKGLL